MGLLIKEGNYLQENTSNLQEEFQFTPKSGTQYLKKVDIKEIKIGVDISDQASFLGFVFIKIISPKGGFIGQHGDIIPIVPALEGGVALYRRYNHDNINLLESESFITTEKFQPIRLKFLKSDLTPLNYNYAYLRLELSYENEIIRRIDPDVFQFR